MPKPMITLPTLITVKDLGKQWGLSTPQAYDAARRLPAGVKVVLGRRIRINAERFTEWLEAGGELSTPGA